MCLVEARRPIIAFTVAHILCLKRKPGQNLGEKFVMKIDNQNFCYFLEFFPSAAELTNLMQFEEECFGDYLRKKYDIHSTSKEERMRLMLERYDILMRK